LRVEPLQAVEKRPSAAFPSSFVVAAYVQHASLLRISGALHLGIFDQPERNEFFNTLLILDPA
jgi:hypothetical protein